LPARPSDADTLAGLPSGHVRADGVDQSDDLVPWNARVLNAGKDPLLGEGVAVADPAGLDLDAYLAGGGVGNRPLDDLERAVRAGDLDDAHGRHRIPPCRGLSRSESRCRSLPSTLTRAASSRP